MNVEEKKQKRFLNPRLNMDTKFCPLLTAAAISVSNGKEVKPISCRWDCAWSTEMNGPCALCTLAQHLQENKSESDKIFRFDGIVPAQGSDSEEVSD